MMGWFGMSAYSLTKRFFVEIGIPQVYSYKISTVGPFTTDISSHETMKPHSTILSRQLGFEQDRATLLPCY